jgi:16S rRNA (guanine966-N2)-methyltransferase
MRVPAGRLVRPTPDRVREAVFSILSDRVVDARVLDLYAGSGSLGLESLSRGAESAVFVEASRPVAEVIRENIATVREEEAATVMVGDAREVLRRLEREGRLFDLVFLDPPYRDQVAVATLEALEGVLEPGGWAIVDHPAREGLPERVGQRLQQVKRRAWGEVAVAFYAVMEEE